MPTLQETYIAALLKQLQKKSWTSRITQIEHRDLEGEVEALAQFKREIGSE